MMRILRRPLGFVMVDGKPVWALDALAGFWIGNFGLGALAGAAIAGLRSKKGKKPVIDIGKPGYDTAEKLFPKTFARAQSIAPDGGPDDCASDGSHSGDSPESAEEHEQAIC